MEPPGILESSFSYRKLLSQAGLFGHNSVTLGCLMKYKFEAYFLKLCEGDHLSCSSWYLLLSLFSVPFCDLSSLHCFLLHQTRLDMVVPLINVDSFILGLYK